MLAVENKTCTVQLPSGPTNFRITKVKTYLQEPPNIDTPALHNLDVPESDSYQPAKDITNDDNEDNIDAAELPHQNPARTHCLPTRFQSVANISVFLRSNAFSPYFTESRRQEINGLLEKDAFKIVTISDVPIGMRIFSSHFVNEIKNEGIAIAFEKSRLVVQAYNNHCKKKILIQSLTIQRVSQCLILAQAACIPQYNLYL